MKVFAAGDGNVSEADKGHATRRRAAGTPASTRAWQARSAVPFTSAANWEPGERPYAQRSGAAFWAGRRGAGERPAAEGRSPAFPGL
jgi:hypothetical protein